MSLLYSNSFNQQLQSYHSAPTSFIDDFQFSPEMVWPSGGDVNLQLQQYGDRSEIKGEIEDSGHMAYQSLPLDHEMESYGNSVTCSMNASNLLTPAFFSNQGLPNGLNDVASESSTKLNNPLNLHQFDEFGHKNAASSGPEPPINTKRKYMNFDSWTDSSSSQFKRLRDHDDISFSTSNILENQDGNRRIGLTHRHSLPKTAAEMTKIEKLMKFEGSPCKIRAKRGFATHPRSIAERARRTRISERMRKLQDLFPNLDKQTNTADMLGRAVEYIQELEKQVKSLSETKSKCKCSTPQMSNSDSCL